MNELPSFARRSISVREQREQTLPQFRRSASAYGNEHATSPVEIGTKGSIFSLVGRDIKACSSDSVADSGYSKKVSNYVWHNRLWLMPRKASNASHKDKAKRLEMVVESEQETKIPKWKRFLKKLKWGSNALNKGDGSSNSNEKTRGISRSYDTRRAANTPPFPPLQTSNAPTNPIWERRNFAQISPLDLSHLYTARIKKELARPISTHLIK